MAHPAPTVAPIPRRHRVERYVHLLTAGILTEDDHVEPSEGMVVAALLPTPRPAGAVS